MTESSDPIRVVQLSDLHFSTAPGGYMMRDTSATFSAIADLVRAEQPDLVVVTGDIANEGKPDEYELARDALAALELPIYCLAGNHDFVDPMHAILPASGITAPRTLPIGNWIFLFGDSNRGGTEFDDERGWVDLDDRVHLARGGLTTHEIGSLRRQLDLGLADHAMLWLHHPPGGSGMFEEPEYDAEVRQLLDAATPIRAIAAGHAHTGITTDLDGVPSYFCPSTGLCIDFDALTFLPPGYRRHAFHRDGSIDSEVVWLDDERWNDRWQLPSWVAEYFAGRMTEDEVKERMATGG